MLKAVLMKRCHTPLDLLADGSQMWTLCDDAPPIICNQSKVYVDTTIDIDYPTDLYVPLPSEHDYWHVNAQDFADFLLFILR